MMTEVIMRQEAPYPDKLEYLVNCVIYRPRWTAKLGELDRGQGSKGLTLTITTWGYNSRHTDWGEVYRVNHFMPVPPASYNLQSWQRWLLEQYMLVEKHECMEFFGIRDAPGSEHITYPYTPMHGPGNDPYIVCQICTDEDQRTLASGEISPT